MINLLFLYANLKKIGFRKFWLNESQNIDWSKKPSIAFTKNETIIINGSQMVKLICTKI